MVMIKGLKRFGLLAVGCWILLGIGCNKPNGPEIKLVSSLTGPFTAGSIVTVRWSISDPTEVHEVGIKLSTDNGQTYTALSTNYISSDTTTWEWNVDSAQASATCIIMVYDPDDPAISTKSEPFKVQLQSPTKPLELLSPLGGETFAVGRKVLIKWKINDYTKVSSVGLKLLMSNGAKNTMVYGYSISPDTTIFSWTVQSNQIANNCRIRVFEYFDICEPDSSGLFTITN